MSTLDRFMARVTKRADGCWEMSGNALPSGYARFNRGKWKTRLAHRFAYETFVGPIPDGYDIDHTCRVRSCVNPDHLEAVTHAENMRRSRLINIGRCQSGKHAIRSKDDLLSDGRGRAKCRKCANERERERRAVA